MKKFVLIFMFFGLVFFGSTLLLSTPVQAAECVAGEGEYCLLAPLPLIGDETGKVDVKQGFGSYVNGIIRLFMGLIGIFAVLMIVVGGIQYMTTSLLGEKEAAKSRITNAIGGLILALASYIILNTINPNLVNFNVSVPTAELSLSKVDEPPTQTGVGTTTLGGKTVKTGGSLCPQNNYSVAIRVSEGTTPQLTSTTMAIKRGIPWPSDNGEIRTIKKEMLDTSLGSFGAGNLSVYGGTERKTLTAAGVGVKSNTCNLVGDTCTSVYGMPQKAIQGLIELKKKCNCEVLVTGGSECWMHKTHGPGKEATDLHDSDSLKAYIKKVTGVGSVTVGTTYTVGTAKIWYEDDRHFHVISW